VIDGLLGGALPIWRRSAASCDRINQNAKSALDHHQRSCRIVTITKTYSGVHNYLSARTELSAAPKPLSNMDTRTQAKELETLDQTLLVLLAQAGDRSALEQLLRHAYAPLRRYIRGLVGADLADDVLQETSLLIFRKLPYLREPAVFRPWTFRIASRIAFSHLKRIHPSKYILPFSFLLC
jgi:hypothetical protein